MSEEFNPDIVTLSDDEGNDFTFEVLDAIETDDARYVALSPVHDSPEEFIEDSGELVILKVIDEGDESFFEEIEDDDEYNFVSEAFIERLQNIFEFEESEE